MRKKSIALILVVFMFLNVASFGILFISTTARTTIEFPEYQPIDIGYDIRNRELPLEMVDIDDLLLPSSLRTAATEADVGIQRLYVSINYYLGYYYTTWMELMAVGDEAEIWVQVDLSWPEGDPRPTPVITNEQSEYLADEFDTVIYPQTTSYFGMPDYKEGWNSTYSQMIGAPPDYTYDPEGKSVVLVSNIRDDNYYDYNYPYFVIGVYSPTIEGWFDRNVVSLDAYNWQNYLGGPGGQYEGTLAHEYQHLIHDDYQLVKTSFMNEGCSMFAEMLCGYPTAWNDINSFFATPDNSLTEWGDQGGINILADYGQALLFSTFLVDNYGNDFLKNYVQSGITGIAGIEVLLPMGVTFDDVFHDWSLANLMRTGYTSIDFSNKASNDIRVYEVKDKWPTDVYGTDFGNTITILDYDTGVSLLGSYGTDYVRLSKLKWQDPSVLYFDGDEIVSVPHWLYEDGLWYSTPGGAWADLELFIDVDLSGEGSDTLSILTEYSIEPLWDYGFIQIYDLDTNDWVSLDDGVYCTYDHDENAAPQIVAELPGLTGSSEGWATIDFDLTAYEGQSTRVRFRFMTDGAYNDPGWWIDTVYLNGVELPDNSLYLPPFPATSFIVTVLRETFIEGVYYYDELATLDWDPVLNDGSIDLEPYLASIGEDLRYPDVLLLISPRLGAADYSFSVDPKY